MTKLQNRWHLTSIIFLLITLTDENSCFAQSSDLLSLHLKTEFNLDSTSTSQSFEKIDHSYFLNQDESAFRLSLGTSVTGQKNDTRTMKARGSDDTGAASENTTLPNLVYMSFMGVTSLSASTTITLIESKSFNSVNERTSVTRSGKTIILPGEISAIRAENKITQKLSLDGKIIYQDTYGLMDPSFGLSYRPQLSDDFSRWSNKEVFSLSVPTSSKSRDGHILTRGFIRTQWGYDLNRWALVGGLSHAHVLFSQRPSPSDSMTGTDDGGGGDPSTKRNSNTRGMNLGGTPPAFQLNELDLILMEKEEQRTSANIGAKYHWTDRLTYAPSLTATLATTVNQHQLWYTSAKLIDLTYNFSNWETGADLSYSSDIKRFRYASLPNQWSVGLKLAYLYGKPNLLHR